MAAKKIIAYCRYENALIELIRVYVFYNHSFYSDIIECSATIQDHKNYYSRINIKATYRGSVTGERKAPVTAQILKN